MKIRLVACTALALMLASLAAASDRDRRRVSKDLHGSISWSSRDRDGNRFGITFDFGDRGFGIRADYRQDRYGRYRRHDRYYGRLCPPDYHHDRYGKGQYDRRYFGSYDEWSDWRDWQRGWDDRDRWCCDDYARDRAWRAFLSARSHAHFEYELRRYRDNRSRFFRDHRDHDRKHRSNRRRHDDDDDDDDDDDHDRKRRRGHD